MGRGEDHIEMMRSAEELHAGKKAESLRDDGSTDPSTSLRMTEGGGKVELKPCPFCGGQAKGPNGHTPLGSAGWTAEIFCSVCTVSVVAHSGGKEADAKMAATVLWNRRAEDTGWVDFSRAAAPMVVAAGIELLDRPGWLASALPVNDDHTYDLRHLIKAMVREIENNRKSQIENRKSEAVDFRRMTAAQLKEALRLREDLYEGWIKKGLPQRFDGTFDLSDVVRWYGWNREKIALASEECPQLLDAKQGERVSAVGEICQAMAAVVKLDGELMAWERELWNGRSGYDRENFKTAFAANNRLRNVLTHAMEAELDRSASAVSASSAEEK